MFYLLFILVWVGIITLAKDKIKKKIKQFLYPNSKNIEYNIEVSDIYNNIEHEYQDLKNTLDLNILSIKDQLSYYRPVKSVKEDIVEYEKEENMDDDDDELDFYQIFKKTMNILKKLVKAIMNKIKKYIFG